MLISLALYDDYALSVVVFMMVTLYFAPLFTFIRPVHRTVEIPVDLSLIYLFSRQVQRSLE